MTDQQPTFEPATDEVTSPPRRGVKVTTTNLYALTRAVRTAAGYSAAKFAAQIGVAAPTQTSHETGTRTPSADDYITTLDSLGADVVAVPRPDAPDAVKQALSVVVGPNPTPTPSRSAAADFDPATDEIAPPPQRRGVKVTTTNLYALTRAARTAAGYSGAKFAAKIGISHSLQTMRETGKRTPPTDDYVATMDSLGVDLVAVPRPDAPAGVKQVLSREA